jgi:hypothetical protein
MDIVWEKTEVKQGDKTISAEVSMDRFYLYAVDADIDMWGLHDTETKTTHYLFHDNATERVKEIIKKAKKT